MLGKAAAVFKAAKSRGVQELASRAKSLGESSRCVRECSGTSRQGFASETGTASTSAATEQRWAAQAQAQAGPASSLSSQAAAAGGSAGADQAASSRALQIMSRTLLAGLLGGGAFFGYYHFRYDVHELAQLVDATRSSDGGPLQQGWASVIDWYLQHRVSLESEVKKYSDPPSEALLPPLPSHLKHVRTVVLDLDDVLIHSDWARSRGWRTFKRPGADDFLRQLSTRVELVLYTSQLPTYGDPIMERLDPGRIINYRLYRDSTRYVEGRHMRDLAALNRDLNNVLFITASDSICTLQPDNAIQIKPWKMEADDTTLLDLLPFLEALANTPVDDVRSVVRSYAGLDVPSAFKERMQSIQAASKQQRSSRRFLNF